MLGQSSERVMADVFISLALRLGREPFGQGAEPVYIRTAKPSFEGPMSIPTNGRPVRHKVARRLLDQLNDDADTWEQYLLMLDSTSLETDGAEDEG